MSYREVVRFCQAQFGGRFSSDVLPRLALSEELVEHEIEGLADSRNLTPETIEEILGRIQAEWRMGRPSLGDLARLRLAKPFIPLARLSPEQSEFLKLLLFLSDQLLFPLDTRRGTFPATWWVLAALIREAPLPPWVVLTILRRYGLSQERTGFRLSQARWLLVAMAAMKAAVRSRLRRLGPGPQKLDLLVFDVTIPLEVLGVDDITTLEKELFVHWPQACEKQTVCPSFQIEPFRGDDDWVLKVDSRAVGYGDWAVVKHRLRSLVNSTVASTSAEHLFFHAGVVGYKGRAIVLPGASHAGKSTLVSALLAKGMTYLSDEYAVLTDTGLILPYAVPLGLRSGAGRVQRRLVPTTMAEPNSLWPLGAIVVSKYEPESSTRLEPLGGAEAVLEMLRNMVLAQERGMQTAPLLASVVPTALCVRMDRGEADEAATALIAAVEEFWR